jgi:dTDP-4-amino-4,6-dideoxygalactose transaminase
MNIELMLSSKQSTKLKENILQRITNIIHQGNFIQGPEVAELEKKLAKFCNAKHAIACANGTDALTLALMALDLKPNEIVFTTSFTFISPAEAVCLRNGIPYFVDVDDDGFNMSAENLEEAITTAKKQGLKVRGIISVDLFGEPGNYSKIKEIADYNQLFFIADSAQSFGAVYKGQKVGAFADITTTSFFPTKPLGCYGDGGMIFTNDDETANILKSICFHGKGQDKYHNIRIGTNSRLDTLQAAILLEKLSLFDDELRKRQELANYYNSELSNVLQTPKISPDKQSAWAVYTLMHPKRDIIIKKLNDLGIPSNIYYRIPLHMQPAYNKYPKASSLKNSENCAAQVFCLPMHAYITTEERGYIVNSLKKILEQI